MKKLQLFLPIIFIAIMVFGCTEINKNAYSGHNSLFEGDTLTFSSVDSTSFKIDSISRLAAEIKRLDSTQNGVCDTCVTAYKSVIVENRLVAKELSDQTAELRQQLELVAILNNKARNLIENNTAQLSKLQNATNEIKRQSHGLYSYTQGN